MTEDEKAAKALAEFYKLIGKAPIKQESIPNKGTVMKITVTAAGFAKLVSDLQSLAEGKKRVMENGSWKLDNHGNYIYETIPVNKRTVSVEINEITEDGKYVVSVADSTIDTLEVKREREAAKTAYEGIE